MFGADAATATDTTGTTAKNPFFDLDASDVVIRMLQTRV